ncbi:MAG: hypothetical protein ACM3H9_08985 [Rhodospirillaceae bacterium]
MAKKLTAAEMHRLARMGAAAKLAQLEREIAALKRAFPGLTALAPPASPPPVDPGAAGAAGAPPHRSRRSPMSAAERKVVSERMKRYWDARRKSANK